MHLWALPWAQLPVHEASGLFLLTSLSMQSDRPSALGAVPSVNSLWQEEALKLPPQLLRAVRRVIRVAPRVSFVVGEKAAGMC